MGLQPARGDASAIEFGRSGLDGLMRRAASLDCVVRARARCPVASGVSGVSGMSESVEIAHSKATAHACLTATLN